jgi:hypothetical protein
MAVKPQTVKYKFPTSNIFHAHGAGVPALTETTMFGGTLTLVSGSPYMGGVDDLTASTIYYTPSESNEIPQPSGSSYVDTAFSELSLALNTSDHLADKVYDLFVATISGSLVLGSGPAWTSATARSAAIQMTGGAYSNSATMSLKHGGITTSMSAGNAVYVGTFLATANGQTKWQPKPAPAAYGVSAVLGLYNAYNQRPVFAVNRDLNTSWTYANSGVRYADNSAAWFIKFVDGLGNCKSRGRYMASISGTSSSAAAATVGALFDQDNYPLNLGFGVLTQGALNSTALGMPIWGEDTCNGALGVHTWRPAEQSTAVSINFYGNNFAALTVEITM